MGIPRRLTRRQGRAALVDGISFELPVVCAPSPVLMAAFTIDARKAAALLPGTEIFPLRLWSGRGVLMMVVIDYQQTTIGKYIEFSVGIACTHGQRQAPPLLPAALMGLFGTGQYVFDLPVSSEISVKGGKGIWGMPKHQANLDFRITDTTVSSKYELDGLHALTIEIDRPSSAWMPVRMAAANYCAFRGMLMKSYIYFTGKAGLSLFRKGSARLTIGEHPRVQALRSLDISPDPLMTAFIPNARGTLDDHFEAWFLDYPRVPDRVPEGLESVASLGLSEDWLAPPRR
ncbi:MAG: acetoacetate decarboxylase family protein [Vicinamibacterales bacterium]